MRRSALTLEALTLVEARDKAGVAGNQSLDNLAIRPGFRGGFFVPSSVFRLPLRSFFASVTP